MTQVLSWTFLMLSLLSSFELLSIQCSASHTRAWNLLASGSLGARGCLLLLPQAETKFQSPSPCMCLLSVRGKPAYLIPLAEPQDRAACLPVLPHNTRHQSLSQTAEYFSTRQLPLSAWSAAQVGCAYTHHTSLLHYSLGDLQIPEPNIWAALLLLWRSVWCRYQSRKAVDPSSVFLPQSVCRAEWSPCWY